VGCASGWNHPPLDVCLQFQCSETPGTLLITAYWRPFNTVGSSWDAVILLVHRRSMAFKCNRLHMSISKAPPQRRTKSGHPLSRSPEFQLNPRLPRSFLSFDHVSYWHILHPFQFDRIWVSDNACTRGRRSPLESRGHNWRDCPLYDTYWPKREISGGTRSRKPKILLRHSWKHRAFIESSGRQS